MFSFFKKKKNNIIKSIYFMQRRCYTSITLMVWKCNDVFLQRKTSFLWCLSLASITTASVSWEENTHYPHYQTCHDCTADKHILNCRIYNDVSAFDFPGDNYLLKQYKQYYLKTADAMFYCFIKVSTQKLK